MHRNGPRSRLPLQGVAMPQTAAVGAALSLPCCCLGLVAGRGRHALVCQPLVRGFLAGHPARPVGRRGQAAGPILQFTLRTKSKTPRRHSWPAGRPGSPPDDGRPHSSSISSHGTGARAIASEGRRGWRQSAPIDLEVLKRAAGRPGGWQRRALRRQLQAITDLLAVPIPGCAAASRVARWRAVASLTELDRAIARVSPRI